jgi:tetratricopeptide (TPR) repeat protein
MIEVPQRTYKKLKSLTVRGSGVTPAMQHALALEPGNADALAGAGHLAAMLGRPDEAIELSRRVVELDPLNRDAHIDLGGAFIAAGRLKEAAARFRYALDLDPQLPGVHALLGYTLLLQNEPQMALAEMQRETDPARREMGVLIALFSLGRKAEADQALAAFIEEHNKSRAFAIARAYAWRDDADRAFKWLDTAYEQRDAYLAQILWDPQLAKALRADPRWPRFLDKMGLPH